MRPRFGPLLEITFDVEGMGGDPAAGPYQVVMVYRLADPDSDARMEGNAQALNPEGEDMFSRTLQAQSDIPVFNTFVLSWLQVQFVASDGSG